MTRAFFILLYTIMAEEVILRFDQVSFEYDYDKPILDEASFSVHRGAKITLMGQNGSGKSTIFKLKKECYLTLLFVL